MKKKKCEEWEESRESQIVKENHVEKKVTCLRTNKIDRMICKPIVLIQLDL